MKRVPGHKRSDLVERKELLDAAGVEAALREIAERIAERNPDRPAPLVVGIRTGGAFLAARLVALLAGRLGTPVETGVIDITLYRDDVFDGLPRPEVGSTELPDTLDGRTIILCDDVLFTGRTIRAALGELVDFGRPASVQLAVLVDRGHREVPIQPDYVGLRVDTRRDQSVRVMLRELGERDRVILLERAS